ncbi:unnamed protein product [Linum trigynum]|uniref:P-loop containing nucleoside triphosphate hydrolases superfamily protein n=1 Tax=Linum trigynum TaxID=586398 RepID=A0AAV2F4A1_9ROSI
MASFLSSSFLPLTSPNSAAIHIPKCRTKTCRRRTTLLPPPVTASSSSTGNSSPQLPKLVTFLGKGGSGKTTSAVFAAQHYAQSGLNTCLVIQTQDLSADHLLNCKIGTSPIRCNQNLSAVRLETTKMLLEPLNRLKQADAQLNLTQGVLGGVVGEELGVLPAMDSVFGAFVLERLVGFLTDLKQKDKHEQRYDIIIYDGISSDETLRMIAAASKTRLYLKYVRNMAEKTDLGRLASPSVLRLLDEALDLSGRSSHLNGPRSSEIWDILEKKLEKGSSVFADPNRFGCFLVMDPNNPVSLNSALRYWGCAIQAGTTVSGAIASASSPCLSDESLMEEVKQKFSPLPYACLPNLSMNHHPLTWDSIMHSTSPNHEARALFSAASDPSSSSSSSSSITPPVMFDAARKSVTLFMPGFDKSEIKLYQYRGGSELLVEAGDQRRVILLPPKIQGKVGGAKFIDRSLVITMR